MRDVLPVEKFRFQLEALGYGLGFFVTLECDAVTNTNPSSFC